MSTSSERGRAVRSAPRQGPLPQHHNAIVAAEAGRCAADQNAFWEMHRLLFANQAEWADQPQPLTQFLGYAGALKLNAASFQQCLDSHSHRSEVLASQQASYQANIQQTPTFVIGGRQYLASELRAAVDAALQAKAR